ncbi:MAG TPA: THUMP domain-containing protein [Gemmataceae bacterium]|nr:THUMP domain-containing protein [Gemmataceae bacterium]
MSRDRQGAAGLARWRVGVVERYFATCARGLEPVVAGELRDLGARDVEPGRGGVHFRGDKALLYRANLWLRTAIRVLYPILEATVTSPDELYDAVRSVDWSRYLTPDHTLAVDCNVRDSSITHSQYAALRTKDAICDQFVARQGRRPSVDVERPMVGLNLHIYRNRAVLSLDSSGESLHKRGYRPILTKAPLNEALAAALVLLTGWRGETAFADPLCGSGTLPIEAAWIALRRPPGLTRRHFGFMGWMDFDIELWTALRDEARRGVRKKLAAPIVGSDIRRDAVALANANARAAGIGHLLHFEVKDVRDFRPPAGPLTPDPSPPGGGEGKQAVRPSSPGGGEGKQAVRPSPPGGGEGKGVRGVILCNPPYGERIGEEKELKALYRTLGEVFRQRCAGWLAYVFTGNARLAREIGLKPVEQVPLYNGKIPCRLLKFDLT